MVMAFKAMAFKPLQTAGGQPNARVEIHAICLLQVRTLW